MTGDLTEHTDERDQQAFETERDYQGTFKTFYHSEVLSFMSLLRAVVLLPPLFGRHIGFILNFFVVYPVVLFKFSQKSKSTESFPEKKEILNHFKVIFIRPLRLLFSPPGIFCCKYKVFENYMWNIQSFKFNGFVKLFFHLLLAIFVNVFW